MSGHHTSGGSNGKLWILVGVLVVVIIALAFLVVRFMLGDTAPAAPETTLNISAQISAQDAMGKDVTKKLVIAEGTMAPESDDPNARFMLLDIGWGGRKAPTYPLILTVSDHTFPDDDGLAVYHYENGQWNLMGTYLIKNNSVSFRTESLSPFAFQVISANPEPTATPEPTPEATPEPTPEVTPEPTPKPIDYGKYAEEQEGVFRQASKLREDKDYVIAMIDTENEVQLPEADSVTYFGENSADAKKVYNATILLHYDEEELRTVPAQVAKDTDGKFYLLTPVVEGMLWNTENEETTYGTDRFSLVNNDRYLNLDNPNENVVIDEDDGRTRWLYNEIEINDKDTYTLTYRANLGMFYAKELTWTEPEAVEAAGDEATETTPAPETESTLTFTATGDEDEALVFYIFTLDTGEVERDTVSGTLVLTNTPEADLDATPVPTTKPDNAPTLPTAVPSTTKPTTKPTNTPTATTKPTTKPTNTPDNSGDSGDSGNQGGGSQPPSGTNTTSQPVATKRPSGSNTSD